MVLLPVMANTVQSNVISAYQRSVPRGGISLGPIHRWRNVVGGFLVEVVEVVEVVVVDLFLVLEDNILRVNDDDDDDEYEYEYEEGKKEGFAFIFIFALVFVFAVVTSIRRTVVFIVDVVLLDYLLSSFYYLSLSLDYIFELLDMK
eukprot:CAMPEP_0203741892 /NCGR_PEP_ID=MMETSP0092-20131115/55423_1 /ASSEMBLY_ACC=CAM_ASM_001090 /TAXON_ID=426623 /ORGANISM="Chaetoceros affinis, Strain CCMP159" /LENGTH=145 /DNA_ID=CAMNT_0050628835 /DNA_START=303 /DNA_END=741 /DNA_ORIENTATION=+